MVSLVVPSNLPLRGINRTHFSRLACNIASDFAAIFAHSRRVLSQCYPTALDNYLTSPQFHGIEGVYGRFVVGCVSKIYHSQRCKRQLLFLTRTQVSVYFLSEYIRLKYMGLA